MTITKIPLEWYRAFVKYVDENWKMYAYNVKQKTKRIVITRKDLLQFVSMIANEDVSIYADIAPWIMYLSTELEKLGWKLERKITTSDGAKYVFVKYE